MKKISLLLAVVFTLVCACTILGACQPRFVDYAAELKFNLSSATAKEEVTVRTHIDGDTVHFNVSKNVSETGILKARFLGVDTPESTGKIEEWGKAASNFTKQKLANATSIYVESDSSIWEVDSTGDRYLSWIWYKTDDASDYRLLNLELLQQGLAKPYGIGGHEYSSYLEKAVQQAEKHELCVHSKEKDPDFYYGDAIELTLEALRLDAMSESSMYSGCLVAVEGVVTYDTDGTVFLQDYNAEQDRYYGIQVYYGFSGTPALMSLLGLGNRIRLVGTLQLYEAGGTWQISGLQASMSPDPDNKNESIILQTGSKNDIVYKTLTGSEFLGKVEIVDNDVKKEVVLAELIQGSCIKMENLVVKSAYSGQNSNGEITITCTSPDGKEISIRTEAMRGPDGNTLTTDFFQKGMVITVIGNVDKFVDTYQIKIDVFRKITVVSEAQ